VKILCTCGHPMQAHGTPLIGWHEGRYSRNDLCCGVAQLGTMSISAVEADCGCKGWDHPSVPFTPPAEGRMGGVVKQCGGFTAWLNHAVSCDYCHPYLEAAVMGVRRVRQRDAAYDQMATELFSGSPPPAPDEPPEKGEESGEEPPG
jgi:hypothetical protein